MEFCYEYDEKEYSVSLELNPDGTYTAWIGDRSYRIEMRRNQPGLFNLVIGDRNWHAYTATSQGAKTGTRHYIALLDREAQHYEFVTAQPGSARRRASGSAAGGLKAQMPGQVMQMMVQEGDRVEQGQPLLLLEAMKMEIRVAAPVDGIVTRILVEPGETVERGQQLADVTPD